MPKGQPEYGYVMTPQREKVLRTLAKAGGSLDDPDGFVVSKLREKTGHDNTQALSMVIKQLENSGLIKRDVAGRRTYHIELVASALAPEHRARLGINDTSASHAPTVELQDDEPAETPNSDGTDYRRLADELLKAASKVLAHRAGDPKLKLRISELEARASEQAEEIGSLRIDLIERGEEVLQLKEKLRIAEHNIDVVQKQREKQKAERGTDPVAAKLTARERRELDDLKRHL
ncbi:MAG: hypothetical protein ACREMY_07955 [bacterium]